MVMAKDGDAGINGGLMKRQMPGQPFANYVRWTRSISMLAAAQASGARTRCRSRRSVGAWVGSRRSSIRRTI